LNTPLPRYQRQAWTILWASGKPGSTSARFGSQWHNINVWPLRCC